MAMPLVMKAYSLISYCIIDNKLIPGDELSEFLTTMDKVLTDDATKSAINQFKAKYTRGVQAVKLKLGWESELHQFMKSTGNKSPSDKEVLNVVNNFCGYKEDECITRNSKVYTTKIKDMIKEIKKHLR